MLPMAEDAARGAPPPWREIRGLAVDAEAAGFDSVWVFDHLLFRRGDTPETRETAGIWEAWTLMAALAEATTRVELGAVVLATPFRNPAVLAKMAATLDEVSDGRLILGLGAGWHEPEFAAFGIPFDHLASRFEEALAIIAPLLREGRVDFRGTFYAAPDCELRPRGPRPAGPPIMVGASKPRMLRLTAAHADSWNTAWLGTPAKLAERRAGLEAACAEVGRDPASLEVTVGVTVGYPDLWPEERRADEIDPERVLVGSPAEIAAGLRSYAEAGVGLAICMADPPSATSLGRLADALALYRGQDAG